MELLYLWIEEFKNLKQLGFNFSSYYNFKYDKKKKHLSYSENKDFIPNFFGEHISEVTAIVGKNGSGKSNLLEFVMLVYTLNTKVIDSKPFIAVFNTDKGLVVVNNQFLTLSVPPTLKNRIVPFEDSEKLLSKLPLNYYKALYYSDAFTGEWRSFQDFIEGDHRARYIDLSTNYLVDIYRRIPELHEEKSKKQVERYFKNEEESMGDYILYWGYKRLKFDFNSKVKIKLNINEDLLKERVIEYMVDSLGEARGFLKREDIRQKLQTIESFLPGESFKENILRGVFWTMFFDFVAKFGGGAIHKIDRLAEEGEGEPISFFLDEFFNSEYDKERIEEIFNQVEALTYLDQEGTEISLALNEKEIRKIGSLKTDISYLKQYGINPLKVTFEYKEGGFSTGELSYWRFKARLNTVDVFHLAETTLIVIDEGETYFHPEWQREYFKDLLEDIRMMVRNMETNGKKPPEIQIIFTTHSSLILSDIPSRNQVLLESDKGVVSIKKMEGFENTFGGNLHHILADEFFLSGGLIGEFAKNKIQEVIHFLNGENQEMDKETAQKIIEMVGEPVVRKHLQQRFQEKFEEEGDWIDREIERLQRLKNNQKKKEDDQD